MSKPPAVFVLTIGYVDDGDDPAPRVFASREGVERHMKEKGFVPHRTLRPNAKRLHWEKESPSGEMWATATLREVED